MILILLVLGAMIVTTAICHNAGPLGRWLRVIDYPDVTGGRKRHSEPTPLMGGVAVLLALIVTSPFAVYHLGPVVAQVEDTVAMAAIMAVFAFTGFIDDREELSPKIRLLILLSCTAFAVQNQPSLTVQFLHFDFIGKAFILGSWGGIFTVLSLVGLANAVNMADGKNGLVIGMCLIWTVVLLFHGAPIIIPVLLIALGTLIVAFAYNMRGALFLGDAGSFGLSCCFGLLAIYSYTQNFVRLPADIVVLMFMVPVLDCLRLMISRVLRGSSPFSAGRDHLHHHIAAAVGWTAGLPIYLGLIAVPLVLRVLLPDVSALSVLLQFTGYCLTLIACSSAARSKTGGVAA